MAVSAEGGKKKKVSDAARNDGHQTMGYRRQQGMAVSITRSGYAAIFILKKVAEDD